MKRLTLILGAAAAVAFSAPQPARAQGCSWWDLTCNGLASRVTDTGWHIAGRDAYGNVLYVRRIVDSNGNVIIEQARRNNLGLYQVINTRTLRNGSIYNTSGRYNGRKYKAPKYNAYNKVIHYDNDVKGPKPHEVNYHAAKAHVEQPRIGTFGVVQPRMEKVHGGNPHGDKGKGPKH